MKNEKIELLSPAGSFEAMQAAINAGADAIYFGVEQLNMRTVSSNPFSIEDIAEVSKVAKSNNIKAYLTLNTIMYEHDMQLLNLILKEVKEHKIDAVIAADFAVIGACKEMGIPLHVSTQANISNIDAVQFFAPFSDVVVLARELTLKQVAHICNEIKRRDIRGIAGELIKVEIFVHGALCMAISGKCYLSLHEQNASANRGACSQNCRRAYTVTDNESGYELEIDNEYIMSPKDLCTINVLDQIIDAGVSVLKIEGRSKGADYVHEVTACYREAVTAIEVNNYTLEKIDTWMKRLEAVYNRGFWEGYYLGRKLGDWTQQPGSAATDKKIYLGKGVKYYSKVKVGEFKLEAGQLKKGDTLLIMGPALGMQKVQMQTLVVNGETKDLAEKGDLLTLPINVKITPSYKIYKLISVEQHA
jgi:putative protease